MTLAKLFSACLGALALAGCAAVDGFDDGLPRPTDYEIHGIDVSKYQGLIDWDQVRNAGVKFAWIKATEGGDHTDAQFWRNWTAAKAAGIPRGAYHFVYWCRPWQDEMAWFEQNVPVGIRRAAARAGCRSHAELEDLQAQALPRRGHPPDARHARSHGAALRQEARDLQHRRFLRGHPGRTARSSDYPIWVRSTKYSPSVKYGSRRWHFWQYQSDGHIPGIGGKVDRNAFFGTGRQWEKFLAGDELPLKG